MLLSDCTQQWKMLKFPSNENLNIEFRNSNSNPTYIRDLSFHSTWQFRRYNMCNYDLVMGSKIRNFDILFWKEFQFQFIDWMSKNFYHSWEILKSSHLTWFRFSFFGTIMALKSLAGAVWHRSRQFKIAAIFSKDHP